MKSFLVALSLTLLTLDAVHGFTEFLSLIPNGSRFGYGLGHKATGGYTPFGSAFKAAGNKWTAALCKATYPGTSMTNGEAFGDPCCTWKVGAAPQFAVTAWTDVPTTKTTCATSAPATTQPPTTSQTPGTTSSPSVTTAPGTTPTMAPTMAPTTTPSKCTIKTPAPTPAPTTKDDSDDSHDSHDSR